MEGSVSPAEAFGSPMAGFLSPRSKVAKMLADIDDEIDNAPTPSPSKLFLHRTTDTGPVDRAAINSPSKHQSGMHQISFGTVSETQHESMPSALGSDESEGSVRKPRGRAARRMFGKQTTQTESVSWQARSSRPKARPTNPEDEEDDLYSASPMNNSDRYEPLAGSPTGNSTSNGLFVSPTKSINQDSEEDLPSNPFGSKDKLAELVAQKQAERLAKEAEEKQRKEDRAAAQASSDLPDEAFEGSQEAVDPNIERIMSDATRPSRKASKKALLEMERETQRMAREQALAHQIKVKKKFTTTDLFAKFNFRKPGPATDATTPQHPEGDSTASSVPNSDGIEERSKELASTPPTSPPTPLDKQQALVDVGALSKLMPVRQDSIASIIEVDDGDDELPDIRELLKPSQKPVAAIQGESSPQEKKGLKLARLGKKAAIQYDSSDDELDIVPNLPRHLRVFDKVNGSISNGRPADSRAIHNLKHLSHLHADDSRQHKKGSRPSVNPRVLEDQLRRQAREQARKQQLERIEELKAKGIDIQTTDEREKEAEAFENLLEKARQDAVELRKAEKAARKDAKDEGAIQVSDDEEEDEEYDGSDSEGEDIEDADDENEGKSNTLVDDAAEESTDDEADIEESDEEADADELAEDERDDIPVDEAQTNEADLGRKNLSTLALASRKPRKSRVVVDDEDELESAPEEHQAGAELADTEDDPFAAFNFGAADQGVSLLSPTQAFRATMQTPTQVSQEESFDMLRRIAPSSASSIPPALPDIDTQTEEESQLGFVAGSQVPESQRISLHWETQQPETPVPAGLNRGISALSETPGWEPTQDPGLPSPWSVKLTRGSTLESPAEDDTQSTVLLRISESPAASQTAPRRGHLIRKQAVMVDESDDDEENPAPSIRPEKRDAFREMARRRREALTATERAEADKEMREMMDEQAEESEDEYTGLGGDDYVAPETEQDREMIDSSHVDVDERELAAHFAERQRVRDEAEISRLYKDLTTGVLRRKMGANVFDLEEDEDEMAARRRQMRQQEEARKRKALLKDVNIATLAEGKQSKGKDAFLKAIADDESGDEEIVNLSDEETEPAPATQDDSQPSQLETSASTPLQETTGNKRRIREEDDFNGRPPAKQRRTDHSAFKRPTSLLEVQESVSFLLDEPQAGAAFGPTSLELSSDSENEECDLEEHGDSGDDDLLAAEEDRQNDGGFAPNPASMDAKVMPPPRLPASQRRSAPKPPIVDRLSLKRVSSASDSALGRTAWAAGPTTGGFKVPSLLRRATTNIASGANERGVTTPSLSRESSGVKIGGSRKSSLAYQARTEERKAIVEASAKRREENTARIAQLRRNSSALNRGLTGRFE